MIDFDIETTSLQHYGAKSCETFLTQFLEDAMAPDGAVLLDPKTDREKIQAYLDQPDHDYRAWNTKFDLAGLANAGFRLPPERQWHDAMVAAHIIDERIPAALQIRGNKLFGEEEAGAQHEKALKKWLDAETKRRRAAAKESGEELVKPNYSDVPEEIMTPYGGNDVILTRKVDDIYRPQIEANPAFKGLYELEMKVMRALFAAERRGIPMDRGAMVALEAEILPRLERAEEICGEIADFKGFNPRSPKQIGEALERLGADTRAMDKSPKTKQLVTDEENLGACDHPLADAILAYRGEKGIYTWNSACLHGPTGATADLFPEAYLTPEDRLHPNFRQMGARTGRMSCSNPNFQNIPRDDLRLRYAVKADPGHKLVACDLDAIELVLLAAFAGDGVILDQVRKDSGKLHDITAARVGLKGRKRSSGAYESPRDQGKRLNYLTIYRGGMNAVQKFFGVSKDRARVIVDSMAKAYPEVASLQGEIDRKLEDQGYLESPLTGRQWRMYGSGHHAVMKEGYRFLNYLIQGTAADMLKIATARVHEAGVPLIACVHDELLAHVPEEDAEEAARIIEKAMTQSFPVLKGGPDLDKVVPISAEAQILDRWSQAKKLDYVPEYAGGAG